MPPGTRFVFGGGDHHSTYLERESASTMMDRALNVTLLSSGVVFFRAAESFGNGKTSGTASHTELNSTRVGQTEILDTCPMKAVFGDLI